MNGNKIKNIGLPTNVNDAVNKSYVDNDNTIVRNSKENSMNGNKITNIGYPQNEKDAVCKSYIDDNVKAAISTHPLILKYQLDKIFASPQIFDLNIITWNIMNFPSMEVIMLQVTMKYRF